MISALALELARGKSSGHGDALLGYYLARLFELCWHWLHWWTLLVVTPFAAFWLWVQSWDS